MGVFDGNFTNAFSWERQRERQEQLHKADSALKIPVIVVSASGLEQAERMAQRFPRSQGRKQKGLGPESQTGSGLGQVS